MRLFAAAAIMLAAAAVAVPGATAKDFHPGDLRVCGADSCLAITNRAILPLVGSFYYSGPQPRVVPQARIGAPAFELRFRNGYATGIVASTSLDRFLSYGVYIERFQRGKWYAVPPRFAQELRRLSASLKPLRVTPATVAKSR